MFGLGTRCHHPPHGRRHHHLRGRHLPAPASSSSRGRATRVASPPGRCWPTRWRPSCPDGPLSSTAGFPLMAPLRAVALGVGARCWPGGTHDGGAGRGQRGPRARAGQGDVARRRARAGDPGPRTWRGSSCASPLPSGPGPSSGSTSSRAVSGRRRHGLRRRHHGRRCGPGDHLLRPGHPRPLRPQCPRGLGGWHRGLARSSSARRSTIPSRSQPAGLPRLAPVRRCATASDGGRSATWWSRCPGPFSASSSPSACGGTPSSASPTRYVRRERQPCRLRAGPRRPSSGSSVPTMRRLRARPGVPHPRRPLLLRGSLGDAGVRQRRPPAHAASCSVPTR